MKKILLSFITACTLLSTTAKADEGMWIPMLIGKNYAEMQRLGLRLTADDLYHANQSSLKDAIVHFGGGCTGEMISANGLLITNHHCGYGNIAALSTVENNHLDNGFWAKNLQQELPAKGLSVKYLISMTDVTDKINAASAKGNEEKRKKNKEKAIEDIQKAAEQNGQYQARVAAYFGGNQYILLVYEVFTDVRLVATPPQSLGKFGGDTDNWMWPRHTADFAVFRVYANKDNKPSEYAAANVPYKPKHHLPVSIKGVKENDYSMVVGYPGRTNRYETSHGVDLAINETNPSVVKIRDMRLGIMRKYMQQDPSVKLMLASNYASIANYWKYFIGQTEQLKRLNVIGEKRKQENEFIKWSEKNNKSYANLMDKFAKVNADYKPYARHNVYYRECFYASTLVRLAGSTKKLHELLESKKSNQKDIDAEIAKLKRNKEAIKKSFVLNLEKDMLARTAELFYNDVPKSQLPDVYQKYIFKTFGGDNTSKTFENYANHVFANTFLLDEIRFESFCKNPNLATLNNDAAVQYAYSFMNNYENHYEKFTKTYTEDKAELHQKYVKGIMEKNKNKLMYPDANSTMRITYGSVGGYSPQDAVTYKYYTHLDGLLAKYQPGDLEFDLQKDFLELAKTKNYGRYANEDGELVTCFVTNNDITGGNSGSPMINGNGELTGLAFDGNWEAMSGDIAFDKNFKRTIAVDIRFVLWLIDKYGGATNLIDEMDIRE